jgi:hypothetical protein
MGRISRNWPLAAALAAGLSALLVRQTVWADTPTPATTTTPPVTVSVTPTAIATAPLVVRISVSHLDMPVATGETYAALYQRITALVDESSCDSADLRTDRRGGFVVLQVGLPNQPAACRQDGTTVRFALGDKAQWPMVATLALTRGAAVDLERLGVQPPTTGGAGLDPPNPSRPLGSSKRGGLSSSSSLVLALVGGTLVLAGGLMLTGIRVKRPWRRG